MTDPTTSTNRVDRAGTPSCGIRAIEKPLLAEAVHDRLLESVIAGDLAPGERVNVDSLAEAFGVSRTPVREALIRLAHARLVEISRNSSTVVASWSIADMRTRARMMSGIARAAIVDGSPQRSRAEIASISAEPIAFVQACSQLAETFDIPLASQTVSELAAPLTLFLRPSTLAAHSVDIGAFQLAAPLSFLVEALDAGDRDKSAAAIDDLTEAFLDGLATATATRSPRVTTAVT